MIPAAALIPEKARSSWFALTFWPCLPAKDLAVRMPSAKLTRKIPRAAGTSVATSSSGGRRHLEAGAAPTESPRRPPRRDRRGRTPRTTKIEASTTISAAGNRGRKKPCEEEGAESDDAHEHRRAIRFADLLHCLDDLGAGLRGVDVDAEHLPQLAADEDDCYAVDVADEDRAGEVVGKPAEAHDPRKKEAGRRRAGRVSRRALPPPAPGGGEREDRCAQRAPRSIPRARR